MIFGITIPKVSMNFGIRLFFFLSLPRQTIHTSMIERQLQQKIESRMFAGKAIIVIGARQVGKSTLLKMILV